MSSQAIATVAGRSTSVLQRRRNDPAVPAAPIRQSTDHAASAVATFCTQHPEYARLSVDTVEQVMATYLTEDEHRVRRLLADEGVPVGRRGAWSDEA